MPRAVKAFALATATGACFVFFGLGSFVLSWFILPLISFLSRHRPPVERIHRCQDIVGHGYRLHIASMRIPRLIDFEPRKASLDLPAGPCVVIANHPTLIDVTAVMSVHPRICCVAKTRLFGNVLLGRLLRYCRHIEGGDVGSMEGAIVVQKALERLEQGHSVLVFPEGTRSPAHGLRRFNPGVFEIALRASVPIVPLLITCDPPTLTKGLPWYALPKRTAKFRITQLPTYEPGSIGRDSKTLAGHFQALYRGRLDAWRAGLATTASGLAEPAATGCVPRSADR